MNKRTDENRETRKGCLQIMDAVSFPKRATTCKLYSKRDVEKTEEGGGNNYS
jgi:hypothetical protein